MKRKNEIVLMLTLIILPPIFILLSRELFEASYFFSSIYKLIFLFPILFGVYVEKETVKKAITKYFSFTKFKSNIFILAGVGTLLATIYIGAFYLFKDYLDLQNTVDQLNQMASIDVSNIVFIGLYIIIFNSLLEEFFWRGFLFNRLNILIKPWIAYVLTGIAFSFHHMVFYYNWFEPVYLIIITVGLAVYAMIMNLIFSKTKDLFSCWFVHIFADIAQIYIALVIFGIIC